MDYDTTPKYDGVDDNHSEKTGSEGSEGFVKRMSFYEYLPCPCAVCPV